MTYIAHQEAVEALEEVFPGGVVKDNVRGWGWIAWMEVWEFQIRVSSVGAAVEVHMEEKLPPDRNKKTISADRVAVVDINTPEDLRRALRKCREILLGLLVGISAFCGLAPPDLTPPDPPKG